jgi:hypothetical protein
MGWSFDTVPCTKEQYVKNLLSSSAQAPLALRDHALVGNNLWLVYVHPELPEPFIGLQLLQYDSSSRCWGHKSLDESMGPYEENCPLRMLNKAPEPQSPYRDSLGRTWRDRVRAYHANKRAAKLPRLKVGDRVRVPEIFGAGYAGDYTVTADYGRRGYQLSGWLRLNCRDRRHIQLLPAAQQPAAPADKSFAVIT